MKQEEIRGRICAPELKESLPIISFDSIGSTNDAAKEYARNNPECHRALIVADGQTRGRGRLGRSFISKTGAGIYMSLLLCRPDLSPADAPLVTAYAATVVSRAIFELTGLDTQIKWVNDILFEGKKLAGILTEGALLPSGGYEYCIVGIGINTGGRELPQEISDIATTLELSGISVEREALTARITEIFFEEIDTVGTIPVADEYRRRSCLIGKRVTVNKKSSSYPAAVLGITDRCELILALEGGKTETLITGEVSVLLERCNTQ